MEPKNDLLIPYNFTLEFDFNNNIEQELYVFCKKNIQKVKDTLVLGYYMSKKGYESFNDYKNKQENEVVQEYVEKFNEEKSNMEKMYQEMIENKINELESVKNNEIENLNNQMKNLEIKYENDTKNKIYEIESKKDMEIENIKNKLEILEKNNEKNLEKRANEKLESFKHGYEVQLSMLNERIEELKNENKKFIKKIECNNILEQSNELLMKELEILKSGNSVKGSYGENLLLECLQDNFEEYIIYNCGKVAFSTDINMIDKDDDLIAVESKYKVNISQDDIVKFKRDVHYLFGEKNCIGGIFVSIKNKNIPGRGPITLELHASTPLLYLGFKDEEEVKYYLPLFVKFFIKFCKIVKLSTREIDSHKYTDAFRKIEEIMEKCKNQTLLMRKHVTALVKDIETLEKEHVKVAELSANCLIED